MNYYDEIKKEFIDKISLSDDINNLIKYYNYIKEVYNSYLSNLTNLDFLENDFKEAHGKEGLYLALESLKSLITNAEYRALISNDQINGILVDYIKLANDKTNIKVMENKYESIIKVIWSKSLSNAINDGNSEFKILFSNISGADLLKQASNLINRKEQNSCSMITSNFIATYGSKTRRIGFIYPNDSEIIMASAYDLASNVFGLGAVNKEQGTKLATPIVLEKIGIEMAKNQNEELFFSSCYSEVLVSSKPCGILIIGLGEKDLNSDYEDVITLSNILNLPIYELDTLNYKNELSEQDKYYISYHSILTYFNITPLDISQMIRNDSINYLSKLITEKKEEISKIFLELKNSNQLNRENMIGALHQILGQIDLQALLSSRQFN